MEEGDFVDILCCDSGESFETDCDDHTFRTFSSSSESQLELESLLSSLSLFFSTPSIISFTTSSSSSSDESSSSEDDDDEENSSSTLGFFFGGADSGVAILGRFGVSRALLNDLEISFTFLSTERELLLLEDDDFSSLFSFLE